MDIPSQLYALDKSVLHALNGAGSNPILDCVMILLTTIGAVYVLPFFAVWPWLKGNKRLAFDFVAVVMVATIISEAIEYAVGRERPFDVLTNVKTISFYGLASGYSFPSGHATRIFAVATFICLGKRLNYWAAGMSLAVLVGLSRIYLAVHWPSDVLAGSLLGIVLALAMRRLAEREGLYSRVRSRSIAVVDRLLSRPHRPAPHQG